MSKKMSKRKTLSKEQKKEAYLKAKRKFLIRRRIFIILVMLIAFAAIGYFLFFDKPDPETVVSQLHLLPGFKIAVFASGFHHPGIGLFSSDSGPRMMHLYGDTLFVAVPGEGRVYLLRDTDHDGVADEKRVFMKGLSKPSSIASYDDWIYIAEDYQIIRVKIDRKSLSPVPDTKEVIIHDLPVGGHDMKTISIHNHQLYISVGSSCNDCIEKDVRRATVMQCELDRDVCDPFAVGLREAEGMEWFNGRLFVTENGRDWLGDDFPPDELDLLVKGSDYGWPYCHARNEPDPDLGSEKYCHDKALPVFDIQAHSDPEGLTFYRGNKFPASYHGDLFIAYHGSAQRKEPTGYKVVRVFVEKHKDEYRFIGSEDFVSGFRQRDGTVLGRPVDVINWVDGSLLISDDKAGAIYRVWYEE